MTPSAFPNFAVDVRRRFNELATGKLFTVETDRDEIWNRYLKSFPAGSDPIFRKKTEHDCSCCRHFIRAVGNVVGIKNGVMHTIWELTGLPHPYQAVADAMNEYVCSCKVHNAYLTKFDKFGQPTSTERLESGGSIVWEHFSVDVPRAFHHDAPDTKLGHLRANFDVLKRGVTEIPMEAVTVVLDLINENGLYRGAEFQERLTKFRDLKIKLQDGNELAIWEASDSPVARLRNDVIGTLLQDLAEGKDVANAVRAYEAKVAPTNYKRPTAIITQAMAENAMKTIRELDLEPALDRRHASFSDISVDSILWVDGSVRSSLKGGLEALLMESVAPPAFDPKKAKPISIADFLAMKHQQGVRLYMSNSLVPHLVSMTAPVHPEVKSLFRWNNDFAWTYNGNVADSIKEKVKRAGGQVEGVALRCSLAWNNFDDLDLHCQCPQGHVYYADKKGILDVDMNAGGARSREPVENMRWKAPVDGDYRFAVNNYNRRETIDYGFMVEVESALGVFTFRFPKALANGVSVDVCRVLVRGGRVAEVTPAAGIECGELVQECWGLKTQNFIKVNAIVQSPNYWDGNAVGNKHWFFILDKCKNPEPCRGIYNEFLHPRLEPHRKVFEMVGNKTKCPVVDNQMSGVGFSSTRNDQVFLVSNGVTYAVSF